MESAVAQDVRRTSDCVARDRFIASVRKPVSVFLAHWLQTMSRTRSSEPTLPDGSTRIWRMAGGGAADPLPDSDTEQRPEHKPELVGYLNADGVIFRLRWGEGQPVGRCGEQMTILRTTTYGERELGRVALTGAVSSAGLFEGGELGWMEPDGAVLRGGLILGEEEVGRVEGPRALEAAAALLLLFLPDAFESDRDAQRRS